jgi:hypothetical protein
VRAKIYLIIYRGKSHRQDSVAFSFVCERSFFNVISLCFGLAGNDEARLFSSCKACCRWLCQLLNSIAHLMRITDKALHVSLFAKLIIKPQ